MKKGKFSFEEHCTGIVQTLCGVTIADCLGLNIELLERASNIKFRTGSTLGLVDLTDAISNSRTPAQADLPTEGKPS